MLGLSEYEPAFRENQVDSEVLLNLTGDDLRELGVVSVGHRRKLLSAIAELSATSARPNAVMRANRAEPALDVAERRQLTVMFVDLVGSTALSARLDPEDMREVIATYHQCCASLIAANGGFVAKYMGDGVLAYFGYPHAHEHDAERAVRAGLAIANAAPKFKTAAQAPLHVRAGIATGIVVVGDLFRSGGVRALDIVGDTPNLAARLQAIAGPDCVVIAESTRRLLGDLFELDPLPLKGVAEPTRVWAAVRESSEASRFDALHSGRLTPLVGREQEIGVLLRSWVRAKEGQGHVFLLSGEAGIGKSRLTAEFLERLTDEPYARLRYFCSPQHTDSAFYPIIGHLTRRARLANRDDAQTKLDKLDALLATSAASPEDAALIAEMLSLPNDGRYPELDLAPSRRRQKTMEALTGRVEVMSRRSPVLIIFEDAHWADPSSLEAFGQIIDRIGALRALMLVTFRPEFDAPWVGRPNVTPLAINRLAPDAVLALIDHIAVGGRALPENIRQDIVDRSDCIPLFAEEITKAVLEAESEGAPGPAATGIRSPALGVPPSLHASLMARLDRQGPAKGVAQVGAAIGRGFSHALLASAAALPESELNSGLDRLLQSGLLSRQGAPPHATYLFKHALVQDAAYGTLLREPKRALHARIAEVLEAQFADVIEGEPELLARHCTDAGMIEKASRQWGKAGLRSLARSALREAKAQLTRALAQVATLPSTPVLRQEQIRLQVGLAQALTHLNGYAAPETKRAFEQARIFMERAHALGEHPEDPLALFWVLYGFWAVNYVAFDENVVRDLATQFMALAQKQGGTIPIMIGHRLVGCTLLSGGEIAASRPHFDQAIALYNPAEQEATARFAPDFTVMSISWRALASWILGYSEAALADLDAALAMARRIGRAVDLMFVLIGTQPTRIHSGDYATARAQLDEGLALASEKGASFWRAMGTMFEGCVFALTGEPAAAVSSIVSAIEPYRSTGARLYMPFYLSYLAQAYADLGQFDEARGCVDEALANLGATGTKWLEADIHRVSGEIALLSPGHDAAKAQVCFERALAIARAREARSWELRAAMSLARLWRDQGRRAKARNLLAPVYGWFTEGFETRDLKEARALLEELG